LRHGTGKTPEVVYNWPSLLLLKGTIVNKFTGKLLILAACSLVIPGSFAADKKYTTQKEKISYAIGVQVGNNIKAQNLEDFDAKIISEAIADVLTGSKLRLTDDEMKTAVSTYQQELVKKRADAATAAKSKGEKFMAENKKRKGVKTTDSGMQYEILKEGSGEKPKATDQVTVHYHGTLIDGTVFDSSVQRGTPATFPLNGVIKGWTEIVQMMPVGSKWKVVIPPQLAYGENGAGGAIGPNETLIFEIELISIKK
jgi:FKBP-type peptidyl-prolyl cis-trans isomerase